MGFFLLLLSSLYYYCLNTVTWCISYSFGILPTGLQWKSIEALLVLSLSHYIHSIKSLRSSLSFSGSHSHIANLLRAFFLLTLSSLLGSIISVVCSCRAERPQQALLQLLGSIMREPPRWNSIRILSSKKKWKLYFLHAAFEKKSSLDCLHDRRAGEAGGWKKHRQRWNIESGSRSSVHLKYLEGQMFSLILYHLSV